jgi:hypothetical protein
VRARPGPRAQPKKRDTHSLEFDVILNIKIYVLKISDKRFRRGFTVRRKLMRRVKYG